MRSINSRILLLAVLVLLITVVGVVFRLANVPYSREQPRSAQVEDNHSTNQLSASKPSVEDVGGVSPTGAGNMISTQAQLGAAVTASAELLPARSDSMPPTNNPGDASPATNRPPLIELGLIWIPAGTFPMGSPNSELGRRNNEGPQTLVTISRGFWLAKYEATVGQYRTVTGTFPERGTVGVNDDPEKPVTLVSWEQATNFCHLLTQFERDAGRLPEGYVYRLPTEAEWEYACRAGTSTRFSFGDDPVCDLLPSHAWFRTNTSFALLPAQKVGAKAPNPWGLYDMEGNASEWCWDFILRYPGGSVTDLIGTLSHPQGFQMLRGGSAEMSGPDCRCAVRVSGTSVQGTWNAGFRVALAPELPPTL